MGFAPAAESAEGDVLITRADAHRTPPRTAPEPVPDGPPVARRHPARGRASAPSGPATSPPPPRASRAPAPGGHRRRAAPHRRRRDPRHHAGGRPDRRGRCGSATSTPRAPPASGSSPRSGSRAASSRRTTTPPTRSAPIRCTGSPAWRSSPTTRADDPLPSPLHDRSRAASQRPLRRGSRAATRSGAGGRSCGGEQGLSEHGDRRVLHLRHSSGPGWEN